MLKIKDDVDLKELEKFGFVLSDDGTYYKDGDYYDIRTVDIDDRILSHLVEEIGYWVYDNTDEFLEIEFDDLIKADMVEKIEE